MSYVRSKQIDGFIGGESCREKTPYIFKYVSLSINLVGLTFFGSNNKLLF